MSRRRVMRPTGGVKVRFYALEEMIRSALCQKLQAARGNMFTIKAGQLCSQMMSIDDMTMRCRVAVRRYVESILKDAIVSELSTKQRIVILVNKAREVLGCNEN